MAPKYSKDKYAHIKNLKNEPLANLTFDLKKRKLSDEKVDTNVLPPVHTAPPSPTPSLEVIAVTPPLTRAKGKDKVGMSVWDDLAIALGCAQNVITNDELKSLLSVPSHELISQHIHKLVQVCNSIPPVFLFSLLVLVGMHNLPSYLLIPIRSLGNLCAS